MSLSTRNIPATSVSKTFRPGNVVARLVGISYEPDKFKEDALIVKLQIEGPDLGESFEGFFKDPENPALGRYKGQIGTVAAGQYSFRDGEIKNRKISRDVEILKFISQLAQTLGVDNEVKAVETDTIEQYLDQVSPILCNRDNMIHWCLGGKEYEKGQYINYSLFLVKPDYKAKKNPFGATADEVIRYDASAHIVTKKKDTAAAAVEQFEPASTMEFEIPVGGDEPF